ncbi:VanZ like family protein [Anaerovirgula multivorans]|uniref:VanZ like family protein n=1 Tax=Anaerovirgula multivorans TaxID=312168 RepID=A0A239AA94_9FIRM|nr:VanZ family protein [Anaerovirgula multivorans]SNR91803.1 VanZ like family protein [Anaerovirgula multivorans]
MKISFRRIALFILLGYTLLLIYWMIWGFGRTTQPQYMYNLIPFTTINQFLQISNFNSNTWVINLIGNIGVFVPFGILLPLAFGGRYIKLLVTFLSGLLLLETLQLLTRRGSFDVDDFLLNTVGFMIGYGIYVVARRWAYSRRGRPKTQHIISRRKVDHDYQS